MGRVGADADCAVVSRRAADALFALFESMRGGRDRFIEPGPLEPAFELFAPNLRRLFASLRGDSIAPQAVRTVLIRAREHFLTQEGNPRSRSPYPQIAFANAADWRVHTSLVLEHAEGFLRVDAAYRRELNVLLSR